MYEYLIGKISETGVNYVVLESNDIGYKIYTTMNSLNKINSFSEDKIKIYTYLNIKEGAAEFYGFAGKTEKQMFERLLGITGIGPKMALAILSVNTEEELCMSILTGDIKKLTKAPGVGPKVAQRIVLELKDKIKLPIQTQTNVDQFIESNNNYQDLIDALSSLGYKESEISKAIEKNNLSDLSFEQAIKLLLKNM